MLQPYPFGLYKEGPGCLSLTTFTEGGHVDKEIATLTAFSRFRRERIERSVLYSNEIVHYSDLLQTWIDWCLESDRFVSRPSDIKLRDRPAILLTRNAIVLGSFARHSHPFR